MGEARVTIDGRLIAKIGRGLVVLVGIASDDGDDDRLWLARKIVDLRIFDDDHGVMNRAVKDVEGDILAVSQFTLFASTRKGNRPSWSAAASPETARAAFEAFVASLTAHLGKPVPTGVFGARMHVALVNQGPVTLWLDSRVRE